MGLFSGIKHAFQHIAHAIEHVVKDVAHGIEHVAKDIGNAAHEAANTVNDIAHGRLRAAMNDMANIGTNLAKGLTDVEKTAVDAAADATVDLHLSKAMDKMAASAKQLAAKLADNTVKAVGHIGHSLANNTATLVSDAGHLTKDVVTGHFDAAKHDLSKYGTDWGHAVGDLGKDAVEVVKTVAANAGEVGKYGADSAAAALEGMHVSKSVDRFAEKASHTIDKGIDTTVKITGQVADSVAKDVAGTADGAVAMGKDIFNGQVGKVLHDGLNATASAVSLVGDLTPEGLAANAVIATMQTAHIGNAMVQDVVGGLIGGPKGLMKRAAETGVGVGAGEVLQKVTNGHTEAALLMAGALAPTAADMLGGRHGNHNATPHPEAPSPSGSGPDHPTAGGLVSGDARGPEAKSEAKSEAKPEKAAPASNWHEVLGVGPNVTRSEINTAYRKLSLQHHPDKGGDVEKQKEINNARDAALADLDQRTGPSGGPEVKQPETKGRDATPDQTALRSDLHTRTELQSSAVTLASNPVVHKEEAAKPQDETKDDRKDNGVADSADNVAGAVAALAGSAGATATIGAAQASAATTVAAQTAMAEIQNQVALGEALGHEQEETGKGVKSLAQ